MIRRFTIQAQNLNGENRTHFARGPDSCSSEEHIAVAAYYNAERRGFAEDGESDDWFEAERQMNVKE
jgi:hypothetical protein